MSNKMNLQTITYNGNTYEADIFQLETNDDRTIDLAEIVVGTKCLLLKLTRAGKWVKHTGYLSDL